MQQVLGLLLGIVGTDVESGMARFSFEVPELTDGIGFVGLAMGLFAFAEIAVNLEQKSGRGIFSVTLSAPAFFALTGHSSWRRSILASLPHVKP